MATYFKNLLGTRLQR
jgi:hypothetical protein